MGVAGLLQGVHARGHGRDEDPQGGLRRAQQIETARAKMLAARAKLAVTQKEIA